MISQAFTTRVVYKNASTVVAISTAIGDILKAYDNGLTIAKISSVATEQKVDKEISDLIRSKFAGKKIIGHIGALSDHHKGQSYIIEAAKELENARDDLAFVFVGSGKDEAMLKELAKDVKSVYFEGFQTNVADYIAAFDLFVFPSLEEGLGSTLIDVMRLEVPIIATSVGGIVDLIEHNKTGILIEPKDSKAIKDAVLDLIDKKPSDLIANAKEKAEEFTPENMAKGYIKLYKEVLDKTEIG